MLSLLKLNDLRRWRPVLRQKRNEELTSRKQERLNEDLLIRNMSHELLPSSTSLDLNKTP